jgi:hypothetical protein
MLKVVNRQWYPSRLSDTLLLAVYPTLYLPIHFLRIRLYCH